MLSGREIAERVLLRLDLVPDKGGSAREAARHFLAYDMPVELLPDVVDAVLDLLPDPADQDEVRSGAKPVSELRIAMAFSEAADADRRRAVLARLLCDALSVLRVRADGRGLERRSDASAEMAFEEAVKEAAAAAADAGSAAAHLRTAWDCVHTLHPDPVKAYAEAIKAVESAAHTVVEPRRARATLGTMLGHLRANPHYFSLVIAGPDGQGDVGPLIGCLALLWEGQSSRHGSSATTREETLEESTMAVHMAVTLVQWFTSGAVQRSNAGDRKVSDSGHGRVVRRAVRNQRPGRGRL
jgi:hypothetical protein